MKGRVLLFAHDAEETESLSSVLEAVGFDATAAGSEASFDELLHHQAFDVVLFELRAETGDFLKFTGPETSLQPPPEVVILADHDAAERGLAAVRRGDAFGCLRKPLEAIDDLLITVSHAVDRRRLRRRYRDSASDLELCKRELEAVRVRCAQLFDEAPVESEETPFKDLFEALQQGVILHDEHGMVTAVNPAAENILGRPARELLGKDCRASCWKALDQWGQPMPADSHPALLALRTGQAVKNSMLGIFNPVANEIRWLRLHAVPCFKPGQAQPHQVLTSFDDVTQFMRVEDALQASEHAYGDLTETIPQGVTEIDLDGTILYSNPAYCRMHGYGPGTLVGRSVLDFCSSEEARRARKKYLQQLAKDQSQAGPYRSRDRCADGSEIDIQVDWSFKRNSRGEMIGLIAVVSDITRTQQSERALQNSERRYRELVEQAAEGICVVDRNCAFREANPRLCSILGYDREELLHIPLRQIMDEPEWRERWANLDRLEPGASFSGECRARRKTGEVFYAAFSAKVLENGNVQAIARDVTERKMAEQQLIESRNRFQETVDLMPSIITEIDRDLNITYANQLGLETLGYARVDLKAGLPFLDLIDPDDRNKVKLTFGGLNSGDKIGPVEVRLITRDRRQIHALANGAAMSRDGQRVGYRVSLMDISEFKQLSKQLEDAKSFEAIATLAGGIAHQFNNALAVIKGCTELLQMNPEDLDSRRNLLAHIEKSTDRMTGLTSQLLAYARGGKYQPEAIRVVDMVEQCLGVVRHVIDPAVDLNVDLPPTDMSIEADLTQMQMVLSAALENASEAVDGDGAITVRVEPEPHVVKQGEHGDHPKAAYVHLIVEDTGKGMSAKEKERVFDPFFTTKFQGRGLGMAAAYGIVRNHHGWMEVESELGKGTRVHVFLPLAKPLPVKVESPKPAPDAPEEVRTVFVIDDEPALLDITREIVETLGHHVIVADSGRQSLDLLEHYDAPIHLALLDLILMDLPAKTVNRRLLELHPQIKVVVCSGYSLGGPAQELLDAGAFAFLQKPFSLSDLQRLLQEAFSEDAAEG